MSALDSNPLVNLVRPAVRGWWGARHGVLQTIPKPTDEPRVRRDGPDPIRVLLIGNGPTSGYGVASHDLALPGHLARQLASATGRGTELQLISPDDLLATNALRFYHDQREPRYELIIVMIGTVDAVRMTDATEWRTHLEALLAEMLHDSAGARLLLVGIPPTSALRLVPTVTSPLIDAHIGALNEVYMLLADELAGAEYLAFAPPAEPDEERHRSSATYAQWAALISPRAAALLGPPGARTAARMPDSPAAVPTEPPARS